MQFLESTIIGLRSARFILKSSLSEATVTLFPMVHIGERRFFEEVFADAVDHDVVLVEGVGGPVAKRLTRSYRWTIGSGLLGLVLQSSVKPRRPFKARIVHADLTAEEFAAEWRKVPLLVRWLLYAAAPLYGLARRRRPTREQLAERMSLDTGMPETLVDFPKWSGLNRPIRDARDARLVSCLEAELDRNDGAIRIAVVFGAGHMPAVVRALSARSFVTVSGAWIPIFSLGVDA